MNHRYAFAHLSEDAVHQLQQLESRLRAEMGEEITLIAYAKDATEDAACRADAKGD
jgi:hypothetical protein